MDVFTAFLKQPKPHPLFTRTPPPGALDALKNNADCKKFLLEKLGINASRLAKAVGGQRAFDGLTSTISAASGYRTAFGFACNYQVLLRSDGQQHHRCYPSRLRQSRGPRGDTKRRVLRLLWLRSLIKIIHETLHSFTELDDDQLIEKLGGTINVEQLSDAVHNIPEYAAMYSGKIPESNVYDPRYRHKADAAKNENHGGWSSYFHDIQRQLCGP
jgi:hypothetical protein